MTPAKAILLHDFFEIRGGGERLSLILCRELGLDLCYGFRRDTSYDESLFSGIRCFDLNAYTSIMGWRTIKGLRAFHNETRFLSEYAAVVYSGVVAPLAVRNHPGGYNVFYCHTPPRFIYDQRDFFRKQIPAWQRPLLELLIAYLRPHYEAAVAEMDLIIANSENVKWRIQHYLGKSSVVIHPPCETDRFCWEGQDDYYLSMARLDLLKRVDLVVRAFVQMPDKKLIVTSGGSELVRLQNLARGADNIIFTGWVGEERLQSLVGNCIATIYIPRDEDFGMSPVESMAAGKPVIGVAEGGLLETVKDGETGLLLPSDLSVEDIINGVQILTPERTLRMRQACEDRAALFRREVFVEKMRAVLRQG